MTKQLLGSLESRIMHFFWNSPDSHSISDLQQFLNQSDTLAYTTVSTIVSRLEAKGLLHREKSGRGYLYQAAVSEPRRQ